MKSKREGERERVDSLSLFFSLCCRDAGGASLGGGGGGDGDVWQRVMWKLGEVLVLSPIGSGGYGLLEGKKTEQLVGDDVSNGGDIDVMAGTVTR